MPTHYKGRAEEVRALNAYIPLMRASASIAARASVHFESLGLTSGQFGVLEALLHLGPLCQHELGEKLLNSGGNITLLVDNLEKKGWVKRERLKQDRRMLRVNLTPEGRRVIQRIFPQHLAQVVSEFGRLTADEQDELRRLCRKLGTGRTAARNRKTGGEHDSDSNE
jgi:MarR family transcriptional regulator, 2-MHQ and catechol-resistance regulon repressor